MSLQESVEISCPYCGERITLTIDCSAGPQEYIEDCQVCCQPIRLQIGIDDNGQPDTVTRRDSE